MSSMTTQKRAHKAVILPQFPFLFLWASSVSCFPVFRRGKLETKAVSWAVLPMKTLGNCRETKEPKTALSFPVGPSCPQFPFLFPLDALAVNENASTQTAGPARIKPLAWRPRSAKERPRFEEFKRFVRWLRLPHLAPGKKNVRSFNDLTGRKFGFLRILEYAGTDRHRRRQWRVHCEQCG